MKEKAHVRERNKANHDGHTSRTVIYRERNRAEDIGADFACCIYIDHCTVSVRYIAVGVVFSATYTCTHTP